MKFRKAVHFYGYYFPFLFLLQKQMPRQIARESWMITTGGEYIPTGQIGSYETCIDNLVTYYKGLKTTERNLDTQIRNVENDIAKNQSNLEVAMDSTSKDRYKGFNSNADLKKR
jgi:hypothetical protein